MNQVFKSINNKTQHYAQNLERQFSATMYTLLNLVDIDQMENILEVGGGTGRILPTIIQMKKKSCQYNMIDISPDFLEATKQRIQYLEKNSNDIQHLDQVPQFQLKENPDELNKEADNLVYRSDLFNINLRYMNVMDLKFEDNTFDSYFAQLVIHHSDWQKSLTEAYRVLKSNGKLCLTEIDPTFKNLFQVDEKSDQLIKKLFGKTAKEFQEELKQKNSPDKKNKHEDDHSKENREKFNVDASKNVFSKENIHIMLEKLGFKDIFIWEAQLPFTVNRKDIIAKHIWQFEPRSELSQEEQDSIREEIYQTLVRDEQDTLKPKMYRTLQIMATKP